MDDQRYDPEMKLFAETAQQLGEALVKIGETLQACAGAFRRRVLIDEDPANARENPPEPANKAQVPTEWVQNYEVKPKKASPPKKADHPLSVTENAAEDNGRASETSPDDQRHFNKDLFGE